MLSNNFFTEQDKKEVNSRFLDFLYGVIGYEPYKKFDTAAELARELGIRSSLIYNIMYGKNNVSLNLLAIFQNKFGEKFDSRYILTGNKYVNKNSYDLPEGHISINQKEAEEVIHNLEIAKIKLNKSIYTNLKKK